MHCSSQVHVVAVFELDYQFVERVFISVFVSDDFANVRSYCARLRGQPDIYCSHHHTSNYIYDGQKELPQDFY